MNQVINFLNTTIKDNDTLVIACSTGPDSMFLTKLLVDMKESKKLKIVIAHVNHKLRTQSDEEEIFMNHYCTNHNLIFECLKIEKYHNDNFHDEARNIRYQFFDKIVNKYNAKYLLTAHHGDDLIETILMRITRGSKLSGYSGFRLISKTDNYKILRPLVFMSKSQIKEYMDTNNLKYYNDDSNAKDKYTRNRYRKYVLPFLKKENKNIHLKYLQYSQELNEYVEYVDKIVNDTLPKVYQKNTLDINKTKKLDSFIAKRIVSKILSLLYPINLNRINNNTEKLIYNLIISSKANAKINLPDNKIAIKEYNSITFINNYKEEKKDYEFELKDSIDIPNIGNISIVKEALKTDNYHLYLSSKEIALPLIVRNRKPSDTIEIKNLNGTKKVKDILINEKINLRNRDLLPILTDSNGIILWIPGIKKSKFDKAKTKNYDIICKYELKEEIQNDCK